MRKILHVVCLCPPLPSRTGGAREMLHRINSLRDLGIEIHLHCYHKKHEKIDSELSSLCEKLFLYPRRTNYARLLSGQPFIVSCRSSQELLLNLSVDDHPILFEGIHSTAFLDRLTAAGRRLVVRMHNDEKQYYRNLAIHGQNPLKRIYAWIESVRIDRWIKNLPQGTNLACIQENERMEMGDRYKQLDVFYLPPVIPDTAEGQTGVGGYCLYHGDLSVGMNERTAIWLLRRVFSRIKLPLVIAGKSPSPKLEKLVHFHQHACLIGDPSHNELIDLIKKAQVNVLPSNTRTGIKLKIFDALQYGRHCVINREMTEGAPWSDSCNVVANAFEMAEKIQSLYKIPFTESMRENRELKLREWRGRLDPLEELIKRLWSHCR